jgi:hypothetical protein
MAFDRVGANLTAEGDRVFSQRALISRAENLEGIQLVTL